MGSTTQEYHDRKEVFLDTVAIQVMNTLIMRKPPTNATEGLDIAKTAYSLAHVMWEVKTKSSGTGKRIRRNIRQLE